MKLYAHPFSSYTQKVLIALYEMHLAAGDATRELAPPRKIADAPTSEQYELAFKEIV